MLQILVFFSIMLVKRKNALTLQDSWDDLQFGVDEVFFFVFFSEPKTSKLGEKYLTT